LHSIDVPSSWPGLTIVSGTVDTIAPDASIIFIEADSKIISVDIVFEIAQ
jgi:hypothetical protein